MKSQERVNIRSPAGAAAVYKDVAGLDSLKEEIRVLHLECGSGSSLLQCTLHRVSLRSDPPPKYEALSYTWGDENDRREIAVNGYIVDVTVNLYSALRRLRLENETRVLWIDALCINQTDLDERSQQVQLMRSIYTMCDRTVIWVGETPEDMSPTWAMHWYGDEKDDESMDWFWDEFYPEADRSSVDGNDFDRIFHAFANIRLFTGGHLSDQPLFTDLTGDEFSYPISYPDYCRQVADALAPFYESPWWTRIWTVQEIILPPKATFLYGPISIDISLLLDAFAALTAHMFESCCAEVFSSCNFRVRKCLRELGSALTNIKNIRTSHGKGASVDLWETMTTFRARFATDNRDKVHGVLGLVNSWPGQPIIPNYRTTAEAIYCQAVISTIQGTKSLLPLHFPLQKHDCPGLPSWCVDWTAASGLADQLNVYQWSQQPFRVFPTHEQEQFRMIPHANNRILEVSGRRADRVASVGRICQGNVPSEKRQAYCDWFVLADLHRNPSKTNAAGCSNFEAFWKCLCWDMILHMREVAVAESARSTGAQSYEAFVGYCHSSPKSVFHPQGLSQADREAVLRLDPGFETTEVTGWGHYSQPDFLTEQWINGLTLNTTMFVTDSGYFGLGPPETQVGDEVWCLFGGQMPFVLRTLKTTQEVSPGQGGKELHKVFGTCYVHGIMDGEIANDTKIPVETLFLA
ncbi:HET-domain-containing protein [Trichoderma citrinoviride]|uniref:HET-domain-containing protein n=1 Tax=Trichoderma citrinoviride TaxID=58853 RepID=A0A2T4B8W8_9HYPO|nr:HET-domain-containing protein [Trichoderma citrinoviride]PTB65738.1 HET-domain-containing protein [Trichoderma citrinoviride]